MTRWRSNKFHALFGIPLCSLIPRIYCLLCLCAWGLVCKPNPEKLLRAMLLMDPCWDQSHVAFNLVEVFIVCHCWAKRWRSQRLLLMLIQNPDYQLCHTISQVRTVSAPVQLIPIVNPGSLSICDPWHTDSWCNQLMCKQSVEVKLFSVAKSDCVKIHMVMIYTKKED